MISDILSMLNPSQSKQNASNMTLGNTGTLAKLSNEIKLIENMSLIKFQGSETLQFQGKAIQLLHATGSQQPFTLINTGLPIDVSDLKSAQLNKTNAFQGALTLTKEALPSQAQQTPNTPQTKQVDNLILASRVVNLTVLSTTANQAATPQTNVTPSNSKTESAPQAPQNTSAKTNALQSSTTPTNINTSSTNIPTSSQSNIQQNTLISNGLSNTAQTQTSMNTNQTHLITVTDGKNEFPIISQTELKRGDTIRVLVDANNNMQVLPAKVDHAAASLQIETLKLSLPKQLQLNDMSQLIKQLQTLSEASSSAPPQTQQALKQLIQGLPSLANLTASPETMKQAMQTSGVFSESLLTNNKAELLPADLKLNLSRLKEAQESIGALRLGSVPTEQIANAIERITTTQLRHFSDPNQINNQIYPLHIELPVRNGQTYNFVRIEIDKDSEKQQSDKQDRRWLVKLKFDFEETGRFEARTSIQGKKVSIIFIAEEKETLQKLQQNMPILKEQLREKNIEVEQLDTFQSKLANEENTLSKNQSLIDVRT
ncbi:hypothetical protein MUS1_12925 [Marinomonas ushuaiensis DSM 15871]|uniref:Flagellar hook-length control protein-like C-terminal domain-containing protein n=1 Tax=Marinomonas ushuaiensis DSM 15871 TaxID=1122207 RepID=X7E4V6_9GAMM|nr:flagellar hook-length control protein FliK [Marinomonas ushuaiensis]ETX10875.1 hypothetical protein MUS1_12925 [Marinomonas ushuaiensis DSM 15871]